MMKVGGRLCGTGLRTDQLGTPLTKRALPTIADHRGSLRPHSNVDADRAVAD